MLETEAPGSPVITRELRVSSRVSAIGFAGTARPAVMPENLVDPFLISKGCPP